MPILVADLLRNISDSDPVIDISAGLNTTDSQIKGVGIFGSTSDWSTWSNASLQVDGYLSLVKSVSSLHRMYAYNTDSGAWGTAANHSEVVLDYRIPELFKVKDFATYAADAGDTTLGQIESELDSHYLLLQRDSATESKKITVEELFGALTLSLVNQNIDSGAGTIVSYGGSVADGGVPADVNGDGNVGIADLLIVLGLNGLIYDLADGASQFIYTNDFSVLEGSDIISLIAGNFGVTAGTLRYWNVNASNGTAVTETNTSGATVAYTISSSVDRIIFTDGPELEIATGFGTAGPGQFRIKGADFGANLTGDGSGYLIFGIEVGRTVGGTTTYYEIMTGAYALNFDNPGFINSNSQSWIPSDNLDGIAFTDITEAGLNISLDPFNLAGPAQTQAGELDVLVMFEEAEQEPLYVSDIEELSIRFFYGGQIVGNLGEFVGSDWRIQYGPR